MSEFVEYIVHGEPGQKEKADAWQTAIPCQLNPLCIPLEYRQYQYWYLSYTNTWYF